jgi:hypothetical protein
MRVLDVGSGPGTYVDALRAAGVEASGIDPFGPADEERHLSQMDVLDDADLRLLVSCGPWDACLCLEVAEHLPERDAEPFVAALAKLAPTTYFSAAHVGQGGEGHLNCQEKDYWREKFAAHGMAEDAPATAAFVEYISTTCPLYMRWLPANIMVMRSFNTLYYQRIEDEEKTQAEWIAKWIATQHQISTGSPEKS